MIGAVVMFGWAVLACGTGSKPANSSPKADKKTNVEAVKKPAPALDLDATVARLESSDQAVRDKAAAALRSALADPKQMARLDRGKGYWEERLRNQLRNGMSIDEVATTLGATKTGGGSSGGSTTMGFRLDNFWTVAAFFSSRVRPEKLFKVGEVTRNITRVWVKPPANYTGTWTTYFVTGARSRKRKLQNGVLLREHSYYDNGQLISDTTYVNGKPDGEVRSFHRNGKKSSVIHWKNGVRDGKVTHWFDNGDLESDRTFVKGKIHGVWIQRTRDGRKTEFHYDHGKETGQAAWAPSGKLLYARGTAARKTK
jgi:hypothetical protein